MESQYFEKEVLNYYVCFTLFYRVTNQLIGSEYYEPELIIENISIISAHGELGEVTEGKVLNEIEQELLNYDFYDEVDLY